MPAHGRVITEQRSGAPARLASSARTGASDNFYGKMEEMNETDGIRKMAKEARALVVREDIDEPLNEAINKMADIVDRICDILDNTATTEMAAVLEPTEVPSFDPAYSWFGGVIRQTNLGTHRTIARRDLLMPKYRTQEAANRQSNRNGGNGAWTPKKERNRKGRR